MFDNDISIFFADGENCSLADGTVCKVHFNFPEEIPAMPGMQSEQVQGKPQIDYPTSYALKRGDVITVKGTRYKVAFTRQTGDGLTSIADLNKV